MFYLADLKYIQKDFQSLIQQVAESAEYALHWINVHTIEELSLLFMIGIKESYESQSLYLKFCKSISN